jgi:DNA-binding CsgD family transcriptional regulator
VLALAAFMIDGSGKVAAMTNAAEIMIRDGELVVLKNGYVEGITESETQKIREAIAVHLLSADILEHSKAFALRGFRGSLATVRVASLRGGQCDCAKAIVGMVAVEQHVPSAKSLYGLTSTEAEVAASLLTGARAYEIARQRKVSIETVRTQIKAIYLKFGVNSQVEFISALRWLK